MDLKEAWKFYRDKAHVNRMKTRVKVLQAYEIVSPHLTDQEKRKLGLGLVLMFLGDGRHWFDTACELIEERLFVDR